MASEKERFEILLKEIRDMFKAVAEGQQVHSERLERIEQKIRGIEETVFSIPAHQDRGERTC